MLSSSVLLTFLFALPFLGLSSAASDIRSRAERKLLLGDTWEDRNKEAKVIFRDSDEDSPQEILNRHHKAAIKLSKNDRKDFEDLQRKHYKNGLNAADRRLYADMENRRYQANRRTQARQRKAEAEQANQRKPPVEQANQRQNRVKPGSQRQGSSGL